MIQNLNPIKLSQLFNYLLKILKIKKTKYKSIHIKDFKDFLVSKKKKMII